MSDFGGQNYSSLNPWSRSFYLSQLKSAQSRLVLVQSQLSILLASPVESYNFNAGDGGSQSATYRKINDLTAEEDRLQNKIRVFSEKLYGGGVISHNLRRK